MKRVPCTAIPLENGFLPKGRLKEAVEWLMNY